MPFRISIDINRDEVQMLFISLTLVIALAGSASAQLQQDFNKKMCPQAEKIARKIVWDKVEANSELPAKLLRMHFHDRFIGVSYR